MITCWVTESKGNTDQEELNTRKCAGADTDEAKTVEESLDHRSKLRLMSQFMAGVATYILARIAAILLPLFFVNQPGQARNPRLHTPNPVLCPSPPSSSRSPLSTSPARRATPWDITPQTLCWPLRHPPRALLCQPARLGAQPRAFHTHNPVLWPAPMPVRAFACLCPDTGTLKMHRGADFVYVVGLVTESFG